LFSALVRGGQAALQLPHLVHIAWSMTWTIPALPRIASAGQELAHLLHPRHFSGSIQ
jgi:hypothetical protein